MNKIPKEKERFPAQENTHPMKSYTKIITSPNKKDPQKISFVFDPHLDNCSAVEGACDAHPLNPCVEELYIQQLRKEIITDLLGTIWIHIIDNQPGDKKPTHNFYTCPPKTTYRKHKGRTFSVLTWSFKYKNDKERAFFYYLKKALHYTYSGIMGIGPEEIYTNTKEKRNQLKELYSLYCIEIYTYEQSRENY